MRQIFHTYKLRLTNLSQANRSLKLGRLSKRRDIDLSQLAFLHNYTAEELLERIIAGKSVTLIQRPDPRHEATNIADRRLNYIYRQIHTIFEETGTYDFFLGYPFVEGKFVDGTIARCPVLLFPVRLVRNLSGRPRWKLEYLSDEPVEFNKTFFLAYEQYQQVRLPEAFWEEEIEPESDMLTWINHLYQKIQQYEIEVNFNSQLFERQVQQFPDYLQATMDAFPVGKLTFKPHAVLGIYPQSDSALLQDYEQIETQPDQFNTSWFGTHVSPTTSIYTSASTDPYIKEEHRYFVTPVDQSQEHALLKVKNGQSLVIHGPPGTGKSQVIVNLIADAMAHGKKVLLASQKRAALDVVFNRLEALGLGRFAVLVHDYRQDRKAIYEKIRRQIDDIDTFQKEINDLNITQWEYNYQLTSREIDRMTRKYDELFEALTKPLTCGMTAHQLYLATEKETDVLPLQAIAYDWTRAELDFFLDRLNTFAAYQIYLLPEYPWKKRLSFHRYGVEDKKRIEQRLESIPDQLARLNELFHPLYQTLKADILDLQHNEQCVGDYQQAHTYISDPMIKDQLLDLQEDSREVKTVTHILDTFDQKIRALDQLTYLDEGHWRIYGTITKHLINYQKLQDKSIRWISISYQRARWFVKQLLEGREAPMDDVNVDMLVKDWEKFRALHNLYVEEHDYAFTGDFPLLNSQSDKKAWVQQKREYLAAYDFLNKLDYFPGLPPIFRYKLGGSEWEQTLTAIQKLDTFTQELTQTRQQWTTFLHPDQIAPIYQAISRPDLATDYLVRLQESFRSDFEDIKQVDILLADGVRNEADILDLLAPWFAQYREIEALAQRVRNSIYYFWLEQAEQMNPVLAEVSTRNWDLQATKYAEKVRESRNRVVELIHRRIKERIIGIIEYNRLKNPITYRNIYHQVSKKRRIWAVRKLVNETWEEGLKELVPCWMASPESSSAIFPMEKDFFDLVVFDEASQCFVERALPVMLRGKQVVIAGDDQQLQPLNLYQVRYDDAESEYVESEIALEVESVLDLAKTALQEVRLNWHYRSQQAALINFSNHAFYEGKLQVAPRAKQDHHYIPPLEWIPIEGQWRENRNLEEATEVLRLILKLIQHPDQPSIGIVTFNFHQQELIKDLLEAELIGLNETDPAMAHLLQQAMFRTGGNDFQGIFVKNIENVQGDERDVIIFSVAYGYNERGTLSTQFGLLSQQGGENRLNVAVTRAKKKIYVICSFHPSDLKVEDAKNEGPRLFKAYLQYVKAVSDGRKAYAHQLLDNQTIATETIHQENPIANFLADRISQKGYWVEQHVGDTSYKLDLAIKSTPDAGDYLLGIECEGSYYFSGATSKEREIYRPALLNAFGWRLHRVWARNFWMDREGEVERILDKLTNLN